jgi:GntR family transcriptional regulator
MLPFSISLKAGEPVYKQVIFAVKTAVVTGQLSPGDRFPSIRQISQELRINPNTVQKVVKGLTDEGVLQIEPGIGAVVAQSPEASRMQKKKLLEEQLGRVVIEARRLALHKTDVIDAVHELWENPGGNK